MIAYILIVMLAGPILGALQFLGLLYVAGLLCVVSRLGDDTRRR
jgi:hypothetical protein